MTIKIKWTEAQWVAACEAMRQLRQPRMHNGLRYVTAAHVAALCACSNHVARVALRKLVSAGVIRYSPASGSRPEIFRAWVR